MSHTIRADNKVSLQTNFDFDFRNLRVLRRRRNITRTETCSRRLWDRHRQSTTLVHWREVIFSSKSQILFRILFQKTRQTKHNCCLCSGDPRKMFTDSSFYSAKHHPTVADQVEMAHRISSALFQEDNKMSKGQNMYLNRAKRSGKLGQESIQKCIAYIHKQSVWFSGKWVHSSNG